MSFKLASGHQVMVNQAFTRRDPRLSNAVLAQALSKVDPRMSYPCRGFHETYEQEVWLPDFIGEITCVSTTWGGAIVFAHRPACLGPTRFVFGLNAQPTKVVYIVLKKSGDDYLLIEARLGLKPVPEPWEEDATGGGVGALNTSYGFWLSHALILGSTPIMCFGCNAEVSQLYIARIHQVALCENCRIELHRIHGTGDSREIPYKTVPVPGWHTAGNPVTARIPLWKRGR